MALTADNKMILEKQWLRTNCKKQPLKIPAGKLDHGVLNNALHAAKRELNEETSISTSLKKISHFTSVVVWMNNMTLYLATGIKTG